MAAMATVVTPGEPVVKLCKFVLSCQVHLLIRLPRSCKTMFIHKSILTIYKRLKVCQCWCDITAIKTLDWQLYPQVQLPLHAKVHTNSPENAQVSIGAT